MPLPKYKPGDRVIATIGRKELEEDGLPVGHPDHGVQRDRHEATVIYVTPPEKLGAHDEQTYHVEINLPGMPTFSCAESDLAPIAEVAAAAAS